MESGFWRFLGACPPGASFFDRMPVWFYSLSFFDPGLSVCSREAASHPVRVVDNPPSSSFFFLPAMELTVASRGLLSLEDCTPTPDLCPAWTRSDGVGLAHHPFLKSSLSFLSVERLVCDVSGLPV